MKFYHQAYKKRILVSESSQRMVRARVSIRANPNPNPSPNTNPQYP